MISGSEIKMNNTKETILSAWSFEKGIEEFIKNCELKNLRSKTINNYLHQFDIFNDFIQKHTLYQTIDQITQYDMNNYVLHLKRSGIKDTSVNSYLRGIRAIINFWYNNGQCNHLKIRMQKTDKQIKDTYTDEELIHLLRKPNVRSCEFTTYRNWCIVNFFLATGVRVSTLINIRIKDIDFDFDRILLNYTKNRKSYIIPMSGQLKLILKEYLTFRKGSQNDYLFCNVYGDQMTQDSVKHAITKYNKSRGVNKYGLHMFRHTFAKKCVLNGVNVFVLQRLMGHSDLSVTKEYIDLYSNDLAQDIENYNPLDTLGNLPKVSQKKKELRKRITM